MAEKEYFKLTPSRQQSGFAIVASARSGLWLGRDHLLLVMTNGYVETYKRFYFADIQAIVLRRTKRAEVIALVTGFLMAVFGSAALSLSAIEANWVFGIVAVVCAIPFVVNVLYGPTCSCELRTAVQTEPLPSLSRVNRARKAMARLRPLIAAAQGEMSGEEISARMLEMNSTPPTAHVKSAAAPGIVADPNVPPRMTA